LMLLSLESPSFLGSILRLIHCFRFQNNLKQLLK
jgi:hypothetical protein